MDNKLTRSIQSLYAVAAVQGLTMIYSILTTLELNLNLSKNAYTPPSFVSLIGASLIWPIALLITIYFIVRNIKSENEWAWMGAISIFILTLPSFSIVFSAFGLLNLLDQEVRHVFLKKLDIKI